MNNVADDIGYSLENIFKDSYVVPLYQRGFTWKDTEIEQLLQDVFESYEESKHKSNGKYFIGSLVVLKRHNGMYEIVDGQQRLTVLSLISRMLGFNSLLRLSYDTRPEVERFLSDFYDKYKLGDYKHDNDSSSLVKNLENAVGYIENTILDAKDENSKKTILYLHQNDQTELESFVNYLKNNVILVRVILPEDTDVASYFEIMNNRGEQLQKHEIIKARLLEKIQSAEGRKTFAKIWDACAQMDEPIQKLFLRPDKMLYFGNEYDSFSINKVDIGGGEDNSPEEKTIDEIIKENLIVKVSREDEDEDKEEQEGCDLRSIIDFPNFLMHVLKLYYSDNYIKTGEQELPLNEKFLAKVYDKLESEIKPIEFIKRLFLCRVLFDRFVIKIETEESSDDKERWALYRPKVSGGKKRTVRYTKNLFDNPEQQKRIIMALSMLHVTFRTRIYKNWLQSVLKWLTDNYKESDFSNISFELYIKELDKIICSYYDNNSEYKEISTNSDYGKGVNTPHFIFNFIDYLYWVESKNKNQHVSKETNIKDFDFKNWNSVEHHLAQNLAKANGCEDCVDSLGNLCLISKESNSRLSDRDVTDKVKYYKEKNLGANRQVIYNITERNGYKWGAKEIEDHYQALVDLIEKRDNILDDK